MNWSFYALVLGFCIDLLLGDPHGFPHPVVLIGKLTDALGRLFRALLPKTKPGEIAAGFSGSSLRPSQPQFRRCC